MDNELLCERCNEPSAPLYQDTDGKYVGLECMSKEGIDRYPGWRERLEATIREGNNGQFTIDAR